MGTEGQYTQHISNVYNGFHLPQARTSIWKGKLLQIRQDLTDFCDVVWFATFFVLFSFLQSAIIIYYYFQ